MSQKNVDVNKLSSLEVEMVRALREMTPEARADLLALGVVYTELFPREPVLRLVHSRQA